MAKLMLMLFVYGACLLHLIYASCPPITGVSGQYNYGHKLQIACIERQGVYYEAECGNDGIWNHGNRDRSCVVQSGQADPGYQPPKPQAPAPRPPAPKPVAPKPKGCNYLPGNMRPADSGRLWADGSRYRMKCIGKNRLFIATCNKVAWVYELNYCEGPEQGNDLGLFGPVGEGSAPAPLTPIGYDDKPHQTHESHQQKPHSQGGILDGFSDVFSSFFKPGTPGAKGDSGFNIRGLVDPVYNILKPKPDGYGENYEEYPYCSYNDDLMEIEYRGKVFSQNYKYTARCKNEEHEGRYFILVCDNGNWKYDEKDCDSLNSLFPMAFNEFPYWLLSLFLRG